MKHYPVGNRFGKGNNPWNKLIFVALAAGYLATVGIKSWKVNKELESLATRFEEIAVKGPDSIEDRNGDRILNYGGKLEKITQKKNDCLRLNGCWKLPHYGKWEVVESWVSGKPEYYASTPGGIFCYNSLREIKSCEEK